MRRLLVLALLCAAAAFLRTHSAFAQSVSLQATSPGTQQSGNFNVSGTGIAKLQDLGGQVYNVRNAYPNMTGCSTTPGAAGDGTTDDTASIGCAIKAAAARTPTRGVVYFPPGTYATTGSYDLTGLHGLAIVGSGITSTTLRLTSATNDLFSWSAGCAQDQTFRDFLVDSDTVTRTGGWVFHVNASYDSSGYLVETRFSDIDIRRQVNGMWLAQFVSVYLTNVVITRFADGSGVGLHIGQASSGTYNQGSGMILKDVQVFGNNFLDSSSTPVGTGVIIEDCDAVVASNLAVGGCINNCLVLKANSGGPGSHNHFFVNSSFDATKTGHSVWSTGGGNITEIRFSGCWFAAAGKLAGGSASLSAFRIDTSLGRSTISGSTFWNATGTLLYIGADSILAITGCTFSANSGQDAIYISDGALNNVGPVITGNFIAGGGSGGVSIRTDATANRIVVVGNTLINSPVWGILPSVFANNGS